MLGTSHRQICSREELENVLTEPDDALCDFLRDLSGDILLLGVGGKIGPSLARMLQRACQKIASKRKIIGVSSFSSPGLQEELESQGICTIRTDMLAPNAVHELPDMENVIYMAGRKFGTAADQGKTWATNVFLSGLVAQRFAQSRIVVFSSGNIYPFVPIGSGGATEQTQPDPKGEYAMSCLGRERMFDHVSQTKDTRVLHFRLNYAVELRYGVVVDLALRILQNETIDVTMGYFNAVWQRYVCSVALQGLGLASSPPRILNVTGPETVSVRWLAERLGKLLGRKPKVVGEEAPTALLSNAYECHRLFGYPDVPLDSVVELVADWLLRGGEVWNKPTHFETRDGNY